MNYKRKHKHTSKIIKRKALNSSLKGWTYGRQIAKEVIERNEFKMWKTSTCR